MALEDLLTGMANAVRQQDGTTAQINASDLPKRIFEIPGNVPGAASKTYTGEAGLKELFNDAADSIRALDGTTAEIVANTFPERIQAINVADLKLPVPTMPSSPTYTGSTITPAFPNYDSTKMNATGNTGTNAGNYTATFTLKQPHYRWADGSKTAKSVEWSIRKSKNNVTVSPSTATIRIGKSESFLVSREGNGQITVESSPSGLQVSVSGNIITVTNTNNTQYWNSLRADVAEDVNYEPGHATFVVFAGQ